MLTLEEIIYGRIAQALNDLIESGKVGIIVKGYYNISPYSIVAKLNANGFNNIKLAAVGYPYENIANNLETTDCIEKAVEWRSQPENSGRIVVFVSDEVPKMQSLIDFEEIGARDFSLWLIDWAKQMVSGNNQLNDFWELLKEDVASYPFMMLEKFIKAVYDDLHKPDVVPNNLWRLGLLRDTRIFNNNKTMSDRLKRNRELLLKMGQLSEDSRRRINNVISNATGTKKTKLLDTYRNLQEYYKRGGVEPLKNLDFDDVSELIISSNKKTNKSRQTNAATEPVDNDKILKGRELSQALNDCFVQNDDESQRTLKDIAGHLHASLTDENSSSIEQYTNDDNFDGQTISFDQIDKDLIRFIGYLCNGNSWGGVCNTGAEHIKDAIRKAKPEDIMVFNPRDPNNWLRGRSFFNVIESLSNQTGRSFSDIILDLTNYRNILLKYIDLIMIYPLVLFGGIEEARTALIKYIESYSELIRGFKEVRLYNQDMLAIRTIAEGLLKLEVILIETPNEWKGILTPLHPFHLWRYYEVSNTVNRNDVNISENEQKQLSDALTQMPHLLHYLINTAVSSERNTQPVLPQSGYLGLLPTYENKTNRFLGNDGVEFIKDLLNRWIAFAPYTRNEIRLGLIDTPDIKESIKMVLDFLKDNRIAKKVVIDAYFTRGQNISGELSSFDFDQDDHEINDNIRKGKIAINWWAKEIKEVNESIVKRPVHVAFFFDQSKYSIGYGPSIKQLFVSPLVITYDYEYSEQYKRGTISPSSKAESGLFGDYHEIINIAAPMPAGQTIRMTYSQDLEVGPIDTVIEDKGAVWLVIADRVITPYAPKSVIPLGEIKNGQREIGVWASSTSKVVEQYIGLLQKYDLTVNEDKLLEIINNFGHIAAGGIITVPRYGGSYDDLERKRKGLLGTIITAAWYAKKYPNSLIASLDTKLARLWLSRRQESGERADLIGLRVDNETIIIEPIEVKSHKESDTINETVNETTGLKELQGKPVEQVESMLSILEQIFMYNHNEQILTQSRREVLKYQLHTECFRELHETEWRSAWYQNLKRLFSNDPNNRANIVIKGIVSNVLFEENGLDLFKEYQEQNISMLTIRRGKINQLLGSNDPEDNHVSFNSDNSYGETRISQNDETVEEVVLTENDPETAGMPENRNDEYNWNDSSEDISHDELNNNSRAFILACEAYGINVEECSPSRVSIGPSTIRFRVKLARGQSFRALRDKLDDIEREMSKSNLMVSSIPNSNEIALDIPRANRSIVPLLPVLNSLSNISSIEELPFPVGISVEGEAVIANLNEMPHLLIGGSTGSGKTILLYSIITALLKNHPTPEQLKLFISSSGLEDFIFFENLPHLIENRVITDANEATNLIQSLINDEFERRKDVLTEARCPNINVYNANRENKMPPIVVIVDEFADLTDSLDNDNKKTFFDTIRRIVQIGRKRGIHLVLCTQRPSATLVPTNIRAQINARIGLRVNDIESSRMILNETGAQNLQKHGDLLFKDGELTKRLQGYFIGINELETFLSNYL